MMLWIKTNPNKSTFMLLTRGRHSSSFAYNRVLASVWLHAEVILLLIISPIRYRNGHTTRTCHPVTDTRPISFLWLVVCTVVFFHIMSCSRLILQDKIVKAWNQRGPRGKGLFWASCQHKILEAGLGSCLCTDKDNTLMCLLTTTASHTHTIPFVIKNESEMGGSKLNK